MGNKPVAASSPPEKQRSADNPSRTAGFARSFKKCPKNRHRLSPVRVKKCGGKAAMDWPLGDEALFQQQEFPNLAGSPAISFPCVVSFATSLDSTDDIICDIYEAAAVPEYWPKVLRADVGAGGGSDRMEGVLPAAREVHPHF
jgi:hypothetical protein